MHVVVSILAHHFSLTALHADSYILFKVITWQTK